MLLELGWQACSLASTPHLGESDGTLRLAEAFTGPRGAVSALLSLVAEARRAQGKSIALAHTNLPLQRRRRERRHT